MLRSGTRKTLEFHGVWDPRKQKPAHVVRMGLDGAARVQPSCALVGRLLLFPHTDFSPGAGLVLGWDCQGKES